MKEVIVLVIIIVGELMGLYAIYEGCKRRMKIKGKTGFKIKHLFHNIPFSESSGTLLIIEGLTGIIAGIVFYYLWFIW
jgi:hypothetical protein